jgi:predicted nucleic acid-binding protein
MDASVIVKMYLNEPEGAAIQALLDDYLAGTARFTVAVPDLLYVECANVLWKSSVRGRYDIADAAGDLTDLREMELPTTSTADLVDVAVQLAAQYGISAYDACYVALAARDGATLVTADGKLLARLADTAHQAVALEDVLAQAARE